MTDLYDQYKAITAMGIVPNVTFHEGRPFYDDGGSFAPIAPQDAEALLCAAVERWLIGLPMSEGVVVTPWIIGDDFKKYIARVHFDIDGHLGTAGDYAPTKLEALVECAKAVAEAQKD